MDCSRIPCGQFTESDYPLKLNMGRLLFFLFFNQKEYTILRDNEQKKSERFDNKLISEKNFDMRHARGHQENECAVSSSSLPSHRRFLKMNVFSIFICSRASHEKCCSLICA